MHLTNLEKETIITFNEAEKEAEVYTYNGRIKRRLEKLCQEFPEEFSKIREDNDGAAVYKAPKKRIHISNPVRKSNICSANI